MGTYLNPGNSSFGRILKTDYIDKTGLIALINERVDTEDSLICISRPRRFGKSYAARMLCAYYDRTCDSHKLFEKLKISKDISYEEHINKYNVIYLDVASFISELKRQQHSIKDVANDIAETIRSELIADKPELSEISKVSECLKKYVEITEKKFIFIIDEWDVVIREAKNDNVTQTAYLNLLREWFKNGNFTEKTVAAAYMTGILPVKKDGSQSAISDFREYPILNPAEFAEYTGFTEQEVRDLCTRNKMDFDEAKRWYDGYSFEKAESIYNPYSVMMAMKSREYGSYWKQTSAADPLLSFINVQIQKNNGQKSALETNILKLIAGERIKVNVSRFNNDFQTFNSEDDVLTLLVHLGYLAYDKGTCRVRIPNEEVRTEFNELLEEPQHSNLAALIMQSEKLLSDTLAGNSDAVAETIKKIRETNYAPSYYNNEQSLRYVIKFAYIVCIDRYMKVEELPSGKGLADVVYIPKIDTALPALVVELKWDETANAAINQIKKNNYPAILANHCGEIVLAGISYNSKTNEHTCKIERIVK